MINSFTSGLIWAIFSLMTAITPAARAQVVQNGDFTAPVVTDDSGSTTSLPQWTIVSNFAGVNPTNKGANPFADNGMPPKISAGTKSNSVGFLLSSAATTPAPASISQTLTGLTVGASYTLNFSENASYVGSPKTPTLTVTLGGVSLYSKALAPVSSYGNSDKPYTLVALPFTATKETEDLVFSSVSPSPNTSTVALLASVIVTAASKK